MNASSIEESLSVHSWPWSIEINDETHYLDLHHPLQLKFLGSPVISIKADAKIILPSRVEHFRSFGPKFLDDIQAYETPHGILANNSSLKALKIIIKKKTYSVLLSMNGALPRYSAADKSDERSETKIAFYVQSWAQIFDDLMDAAYQSNGFTNEISWGDIYKLLKDISNSTEPQKAIIVSIAERMHGVLPDTIRRMRRILLRERELTSLQEAQDFDVACLRWYVKQPGRTLAEKAGSKQQVLSVIRNETFNTLENRVVKDFLMRCKKEAFKYLSDEIRHFSQKSRSRRIRSVKKYEALCKKSLQEPLFESIDLPGHGVNPNYVLQNDLRYRELWQWYRKLIRHETEEDKIWDWQTRTWADVVRLLISLALVSHKDQRIEKNGSENISIMQLSKSRLRLFSEQESGCHIHPGSLPGPFLFRNKVNGEELEGVLELVHPDLADDYAETEKLGRTGGHLYLVVNPLKGMGKTKRVIVFWGVNQGGSEFEVEDHEMSLSASNALREHETVLGRRQINFPHLLGAVVVSRLNLQSPTLFMKAETKVPVLEVPCDPKAWQDASAKMGELLEKVLGQIR